MRHFIISSHSHLAEGMVSALELIVGKIDNLSFYNAYTEEETGDNEHFKEKIMREINSIPKEDDIIIMTDMFGGSVNNELLDLCKIENCHLVTGMNLLLVIGLCLGSEEEPINEQIHRLVEEAKTGIIYCNELNSDSEFENEEF